MNTDFETEDELKLQHLPNGLLVQTKGFAVADDLLGKTWLTGPAPIGAAHLIASGNYANPQPSASTKAELGHTHPEYLPVIAPIADTSLTVSHAAPRITLLETDSAEYIRLQSDAGKMRIQGHINNNYCAEFNPVDTTVLYYNGVSKFQTTGSGAQVDGTINPANAGSMLYQSNPTNSSGRVTVTTVPPTAGAGLPGDIWLVID